MEEDDLSFDFEENLTQQQLQQQHLKEQAQQEQQRNRVQQESTHTQALAQTDGGFAGAPGNQAAGSNPRRPLKQTVCTYWLKGLCMKGNECGFLHEFDVTRMPICRTMLRHGECKEADCPFKHTLDDVKECNMYKLGFCVYGPQCRYKHTRQPGPPPDPSTLEAARPREHRPHFHNYPPRNYEARPAVPRPMPYLGGGTLQPPPGSKPIEPSSQAQEVTPSTSDSDHRPNTSQHARHIQHHHYQDQHDQHMMSGPFMHGGPMFMRPGMSPMHMMPSGPMMFPPGMMPGPMMMMPPHGMMNGRMGPQGYGYGYG